MKFARKLFACTAGATAIEYGLIASLIAIAAIVGFRSLGDGVTNTYSDVSNTIDEAGS